MFQDECYLILGGAGLVGKQIAYRIAHDLAPRKIVIASLWQQEVEEALADLQEMFAEQGFEGTGKWGKFFVGKKSEKESPPKLLKNDPRREPLYADLFGSMDDAYNTSHMVQMIRKHRPDVIVDSINTATAISYQD